MYQKPKGFAEHPYPYHFEIELYIESITNLGLGIARDGDWVLSLIHI